MELSSLPTSSISLLCLLLLLSIGFLLRTRRRRYRNLPPSPPARPIIGHLHLLKPPVHRILQSLSQKYGPIFSLRFGSQLVVIVSSPSAVEECFTKNDIVLANRPRLTAGKYAGFNYTTISTAPYGDHWRNLRRIVALEIFSSNRLNMFASIRKDEVKILLSRLAKKSREGFAQVELRPILSELTFNNITRMVAGKRYYGEDAEFQDEAKRFRDIISELCQKGVASEYSADFLPILRWFGYRNHEKKMEKIMTETKNLLQGLIEEHRNSLNNNSMIDHLLSFQKTEPENYTDDIIQGLVLIMIIAGVDTSSATLEWAMTLLLNNPEALKKAKAELDIHVGTNRLIEESDLPKLSYLQSIIFETLRLFPPAPLLVPHVSSGYCRIGGFDIPADTMIIVNAWAIHRDPKSWENPTSFVPERFESSGINGARENYKLLPFGTGRRGCPGGGLAQRVIGLTLGSMIQCFEWKKTTNATIDTTEGRGITMPKLEPLEAMCKARGILKTCSLETENKA